MKTNVALQAIDITLQATKKNSKKLNIHNLGTFSNRTLFKTRNIGPITSRTCLFSASQPNHRNSL